MVKLLIEHGSDINKANTNGTTPLYIAAQDGHQSVVEFLVKSGADTNKATTDGVTPLIRSLVRQYPEIALLLVNYGAYLNISTPIGRSALGLAIERGYMELVKKMLSTEKKQLSYSYYGKYSMKSVSILYGQPKIWWILSNQSVPIDSELLLSFEQGTIVDKTISKQGYDNKEENIKQTVYSRIGSITLIKKLGSGHFGDVWEGKKGEKRIAIKLLQKVSQNTLLEMIEEISLLGFIKHDNVIQDVEFIPDTPAITMELIEHGDLNSFLKQRKKPIGIFVNHCCN